MRGKYSLRSLRLPAAFSPAAPCQLLLPPAAPRIHANSLERVCVRVNETRAGQINTDLGNSNSWEWTTGSFQNDGVSTFFGKLAAFGCT